MNTIPADHPIDSCGSDAKSSLIACLDHCIEKANTRRKAHIAIVSTPLLPKEPPKEVRFKEWCYLESKRINRAERTIKHKVEAGGYPHLILRRVNKRVIFVQLTPTNTTPCNQP